MRHLSWGPNRPRSRTCGRGTIIGLVLLGLAAVVVVVGPTIASAASWRGHGATGQHPVAPVPEHAVAPAPPAPGSSSISRPSSPPTGAAGPAAPAATIGPDTRTRRHGPSTATLTTADVPGHVDLDAGVPGVAPPASIADNCSVDVSGALQRWLNTRPPGTLVRPPAGACYDVDRGITLQFPHRLTVDGGTFENTTKVETFAGNGIGRATFTVVGGSQMTFEDLTIKGANPGGYHPALAFDAGIELEGTAHADIRNVAVERVYGDGISLDPLRGASDHMSGTILAATTDVAIDTVVITGSGRQGITLASVDGADIDNVALSHVGIDTFDVEADQANEGAQNVVIDGCTSSSSNGGSFFANGGAGNGRQTGGIVVENCRMLDPQGGDAVLVDDIPGGGERRGPFTFSRDTLWCGASDYVGCFQLNGATVSVTQSHIRFAGRSTVHESLYNDGAASSLTLVGDFVRGCQNLGGSAAGSTVSVSGGSWDPAYAVAGGGTAAVSHTGASRHTARFTSRVTARARRRQRHVRR